MKDKEELQAMKTEIHGYHLGTWKEATIIGDEGNGLYEVAFAGVNDNEKLPRTKIRTIMCFDDQEQGRGNGWQQRRRVLEDLLENPNPEDPIVFP